MSVAVQVVSIDQFQVVEGESAEIAIQYTGTSGSFGYSYSIVTSSGTASSSDYSTTSGSGSISFASSGQLTDTIDLTFATTEDSEVEEAETCFLVVTLTGDAVFTDGTQTQTVELTILDDDVPPPPPIIGTSEDNELIGGDQDDVIIGLGGSDYLYGGNGSDVIVAGRGSDNTYGGDGADVFVFSKGQNTVRDFQDDVDTLLIDSSGFSSVRDVLRATTINDGTAVIDLGAGNSITVIGVDSYSELADDIWVI